MIHLSSLTNLFSALCEAEGRASNYLFGLINSVIYLVLALQKGFYGEVLTTLYFTIMQPIGLLVWIYQAQFKKEQQEFVARKLDTVGWTKYLSFSILWWLTFGFIYLINSLVGWYQWSKAAKKA